MLHRLWLIAMLLIPVLTGPVTLRSLGAAAAVPTDGCGAMCCCGPDVCPCAGSREESPAPEPAMPGRSAECERVFVTPRVGDSIPVTRPQESPPRPAPDRATLLHGVRIQAIYCIWLT